MSTSADEPVGWLTSRSVDELRRAVRSVMPEVADRPIVLNDRVVTSDPRFFQGSAIVDGAYLVKFAWSEAPARRITHEGRVLAVLSEAGDGGLLVAPPVARATAPALLVTRLVPGEPLSWERANDVCAEPRRRLVDDLAGFLALLHDRVTLAVVRNAGVRLQMPEPQGTTTELRERFGTIVEPAQRAIVDDWCEWIDEILADPAEPSLLHGDLHGHNLVWDPGTGALQLVADFEAAGAGDPAFDFRYLPGQARTVDLFLDVARRYEQVSGRALDLRRVMAWHIRTVLGDALWRTEAGVSLPGSGGTASSWVEELRIRIPAVLDR